MSCTFEISCIDFNHFQVDNFSSLLNYGGRFDFFLCSLLRSSSFLLWNCFYTTPHHRADWFQNPSIPSTVSFTLVVALYHLVHCINQGITICYELHSVEIIIPVGVRCSFVVCRCRILQFVRKWSIMEWCGQIQCFYKLKTISWPSVCSSCLLLTPTYFEEVP